MKKNYFCKNIFWILNLMMVTLIFNFTITITANANEKNDRKTEEKRTSSVFSNKQNALCMKVASLIKTKSISKHLFPIENIPDTSIYHTLDIDGDGIPDKVEVSSGSEESYLEVKFSNGGGYDLEENGSIMIVNIDAKVCVLVTYWERKKRLDGSLESKEVGHRLYLLSKQNAKIICDK